MMDVSVVKRVIEEVVDDVDVMCGETDCEWCQFRNQSGCVWIQLREVLDV